MSDSDGLFDSEYIQESATTAEKKEKKIEADKEIQIDIIKKEDIKKYGIAKPYKKEINVRITYDKD